MLNNKKKINYKTNSKKLINNGKIIIEKNDYIYTPISNKTLLDKNEELNLSKALNELKKININKINNEENS